jgi:serine phosphatase RsbU (regulator of sigma subunit)/PAS domain-containing protein
MQTKVVMEQSPNLDAPGNEIAALRARGDALRQAATLQGAELRPLLQAALTELDAALDALGAAARAGTGVEQGDPTGAMHAERRLLHAVFQQVPVPLFLLGRDGTVRRVNTAAGTLLGSGPGYATGKLFTAFVDLSARATVQTQLAAALRTGETQQIRCRLLARAGPADCALTVRPVSTRGDAGQLMVAVGSRGSRGPAPAGSRGPAPTGAGAGGAGEGEKAGQHGDQAAGAVRAITRRLDLVIAATRILLENVTYSEQVALQQYARLLSRELSAWVIIDVERGERLRRQMVTGPETQQAEELAGVVAAEDPQPGSAPVQVHESGSAMLVAHAEDPRVLGDRPDGVPLLMVLGATSLLCVPISDGERSYGVLTLARQAGQGHFVMADVGLVEELGEQLALAIRIDRLFRHRSEVADALQASLLPRQVRQIPGTQIAAVHIAATADEEVGGDFYDVYPAAHGWGIAIGDVCGKGEDAAAVTAAARHSIRALAHLHADPAAVLQGTNEIMLAEEFGGRFVTAAVAHLEWRGRVLRIALGSAGHPAALLMRPDGRIRTLQGGGLPLGIFPDAEPAVQELILEPGDVLFLFTDGLTSACGPDMVYFEDRLTDELAALAGEPPAVLVSRVRELVQDFCRNEFRDDLTMLALQAGQPGT